MSKGLPLKMVSLDSEGPGKTRSARHRKDRKTARKTKSYEEKAWPASPGRMRKNKRSSFLDVILLQKPNQKTKKEGKQEEGGGGGDCRPRLQLR